MGRANARIVGALAAAIIVLAGPAGAGAWSGHSGDGRGGGPGGGPGGGAPPLAVPFGQTATDLGAYGELFAPTTLAGANDGCIPDRRHPYPVVLVHGTLADEASNWVTLAPLLANAGYCVYAFNYGQTNLSMDDRIDGLGFIPYSAGQLATFVDQVLAQTGASQVDIVGHSQGGMMPNYYIKFLGGAAKVHELIGLAPSNHGTTEEGIVTQINANPLIAAFTRQLLYAIGAPALSQQQVGSPFETNLFAGGDTVPGPRYVVIETADDEVVTPYTNAFLSGPAVTNILIQDQCPDDTVGHIGMFEDWPVMQNVLNQLRARPDPRFAANCSDYGAPY
jgi:triacylglycerol esterase/lipase EstA (alpha/beta hydrolase family)